MVKECKWCKKKFTAKRLNQNYCCKECSRNGKLKWQREYEANKKATAEKPKKTKRKPSQITDIAMAAHAVGMSYGEYVAKVLNSDSYRVQRRK